MPKKKNYALWVTLTVVVVAVVSAAVVLCLEKTKYSAQYTNPTELVDPCNIAAENGMVDATEIEGIPCEENPSCEWRELGGKRVMHYACCPKDLAPLNSPPEDIPESLSRCFIRVD